MEYNKIQNSLQDYITFYNRSGVDSIKWEEYNHLEQVYKNNKLSSFLRERAKYFTLLELENPREKE